MPGKSRRFLLLVLFALFTAVAGCGGADTPAAAVDTNAYSIRRDEPMLSWDGPTAYSDGSHIEGGDIKGYKIYYRTPSGSYTPGRFRFVSSDTTSIALRDLQLAPGTYFFVVTTLDATDVESDFSNEVRKEIL